LPAVSNKLHSLAFFVTLVNALGPSPKYYKFKERHQPNAVEAAAPA